MKSKSRTVSNVFLAAASVGLGHFGATGFENGLNSVEIGLAAGFGALVMDIVGTLRTPPVDRNKSDQPSDSSPS